MDFRQIIRLPIKMVKKFVDWILPILKWTMEDFAQFLACVVAIVILIIIFLLGFYCGALCTPSADSSAHDAILCIERLFSIIAQSWISLILVIAILFYQPLKNRIENLKSISKDRADFYHPDSQKLDKETLKEIESKEQEK